MNEMSVSEYICSNELEMKVKSKNTSTKNWKSNTLKYLSVLPKNLNAVQGFPELNIHRNLRISFQLAI